MPRLGLATPPPEDPVELPEIVLLVRCRVPALYTAPPTSPAPPLTLVRWSVRLPAGATVNMPKRGAVGARLMVLPLPAMVMTLRMTGRPDLMRKPEGPEKLE